MADKTVKANQGAVSSLADTDLVMCVASGGSYRPVSFAALAKMIRGSIQIGGRNLLLNSHTPKTKSQSYAYAVKPEIGKTYAITGCITAGQGVTQAVLSMNGDNLYQTARLYNPTPGEKTIMTAVQTVTKDCPNFFIHSVGGDVTCHWAVLVEGNIPVTGWTPAPEDIASGAWGGGKSLPFNKLRNLAERRAA